MSEALHAIAETLNRSPDVASALTDTLRQVARLLDLEGGWVWLTNPETDQFYLAAAYHLPSALQEPIRMTGEPCWCLQSFRAGHLRAQNLSVMQCSRLRAASAEGTLRSHASLPLYAGERALGVMNIAAPDFRKLSPEELELLTAVAYQVGIAVERARLAEAAARVARSEERSRMARDLHDTLAQGLTGLGLQIEGALNLLEADPGRARERLQRALEISRECLTQARETVSDLYRTPLDGKPLAEALAGLTRSFTSDTGVPVHLEISGDLSLPSATEAQLYRIAAEALTNVRKHAGARTVWLTLCSRTEPFAQRASGSVPGGAERVDLRVRDDGQGFEVSAVGVASHGLTGMRERARLAGGRLEARSRIGHGTTITARIPR